ncbi:MAG: nitroreductase family protein [Calditrichaceae bacterium]|nr:nitroreductase family protein [Calditrichaceae bacterium]MBN2710721.1 nitroreductase family protein [Calditrichaceae bacterium]RQV92750.1 MAG: NAD(P)H nitroreductase [Calditrichota bacterium]
MNFLDLIKIRQSARKYKDTPVEMDKISKLIEAVRLAPSASNSQPWRLIIVNDPDLKNRIAETTYSKLIPINEFSLQAPVIAVLVIEKPKAVSQIGGRIKKREYVLIDIGIAAEHFCLQAAELGLATCMIGWFNEKKVKKLLNIPFRKRIGLLITLGYPEDNDPVRKKNRKEILQMSAFNGYDILDNQ